jgi:hypothetical protein
MQDKRKFERFTISQIFEIEFMKEKVFSARGLNISKGGLLCETEYPIEPMARVFLVFRLPGSRSGRVLRTEGTVIHVKRRGEMNEFGVTFGDITEEDKENILTYLKKHS